jgi:hypothetical protein
MTTTKRSAVAWGLACALALSASGMTISAQRRTPAAPPPPPAAEDYENFCKRPSDEKLKLFNELPAENRAELVRTQMERWRDANQKRLTPPQMSSLKEMLEIVTPDLYRPEKQTEATTARMKELQTKQITLFTREDLTDMQLTGPCLAKK